MFRFEQEKIRKRLWVLNSRGNSIGDNSKGLFAMAEALSVIPASVLRNLSDKLYEKRKNAALEVSVSVSVYTLFPPTSIGFGF